MEHDEEGEARWPNDLEGTVGNNVRWLRESRGLSQQQLGSDLFAYRAGMHQTTVAKLEAGAKPLRLNEVAAIAAYFGVPIESLWDQTGATLGEHEETVLLRQINAVLKELTQAEADYADAAADLAKANQDAKDALARNIAVQMRCQDLESRLVDLKRRQPKVTRGRLVPTGRSRAGQMKGTVPPRAPRRIESDERRRLPQAAEARPTDGEH
jgi:transcriptional regulator with XRE-family HTH domain